MNICKRIICILVLALSLLTLATGCGKTEPEVQNCIECGKEFTLDPEQTYYIDAYGEAIYVCPDCSK